MLAIAAVAFASHAIMVAVEVIGICSVIALDVLETCFVSLFTGSKLVSFRTVGYLGGLGYGSRWGACSLRCAGCARS